MLNYIWAGLIIFSLVFAAGTDISDLNNDRYRNGKPLVVSLTFKSGADVNERQNDVRVAIDSDVLKRHFGIEQSPAGSYAGVLIRTAGTMQLKFGKEAAMPKPLSVMRDLNDEKELRAVVQELGAVDANAATATIVFEPVRFVKIRAIAAGAVEFAKKAVEIAIGLIGVLSLWLGLMSIAEASGLIAVFVKLVQPLLHLVFPQIPKGHPALGYIALNLAANILGLGNAATPMGLKAMEEMQKLNPTDDTATDPMVMLMAVNTAGVQIVPPATLVAILGLGVGQLIIPILIVTGLSLIISIISCKIFERLPAYRRTNPNLIAKEGA